MRSRIYICEVVVLPEHAKHVELSLLSTYKAVSYTHLTLPTIYSV